ncbi:MAG TPA: thioredoxin [Thermodesulfobacteriaceae bacterium]|nr:thioredoxin [Thermodesulfobacteriaceae bacterium]
MKRYVPLIVTAVCLFLTGFGIWAGDAAEVWRYGVTLCLSCIGIG